MESAELTGLTRMMDRCIVRVISCIHIYVFLSFSLFFLRGFCLVVKPRSQLRQNWSRALPSHLSNNEPLNPASIAPLSVYLSALARPPHLGCCCFISFSRSRRRRNIRNNLSARRKKKGGKKKGKTWWWKLWGRSPWFLLKSMEIKWFKRANGVSRWGDTKKKDTVTL